LGNPSIVVPPTTENPSYPHQPWYWLDQSHHYSHLDPLSQRLDRPKSSPTRPRSKNQTSRPIASRPVPHSVSIRSQKPMFSVRLQLLVLPVLRGPLLSRTSANSTRELACAERSQNSLPCCLPSTHPPHRSTTHHRLFHLRPLTFHVRVHPFCTISLPIEKLVSRPRF
jgi:hypothetical protein